MFVKAKNTNTGYNTFLEENFFSIHGELTDNTTDYSSLSWIIFISNAVFLSIILVNFLIAKLSNKYTELEEMEEMTSYKEKANLIAEIEYFYKIRNTKRKSRRKCKFGFPFVTKNASKLKEGEQDGEDKLEDNLEIFQNKISQLHYDFSNELKLSKSRFKEIKSSIFHYKEELDDLRDEFYSIK